MATETRQRRIGAFRVIPTDEWQFQEYRDVRAVSA